MYQRLIASLLKPKKIIDYINDKLSITIIYLLIFSLIFASAYMLVFLDFDSNLKGAISTNLRDGEKIEYIIQQKEDVSNDKLVGELVSKVENENTYVVSLENTSLEFSVYPLLVEKNKASIILFSYNNTSPLVEETTSLIIFKFSL